MPHAAVIAAAATMGVAAIGAAIAFEVQVFRPWREEHYPEGFTEGIAEEMRTEWNEFKDDFRRGFWDFRERVRNEFDSNSNNATSSGTGSYERFRDHNDNDEQHQQQEMDKKDEEEMRQVQRDLDEFEMNDRQNQSFRRPWQDEFATDQSIRKRRPLQEGMGLEEDQEIQSNSQKPLNDNVITLFHHEDLDSPHHNLGFNSPANSQKSLIAVNDILNTAQEEPRSPISDHQNSLHSNTISDDEEWFSRASSPIRIDKEEGGLESGNVSDAWTQLENSPPGTPTTSASWSAIDRESQGHYD